MKNKKNYLFLLLTSIILPFSVWGQTDVTDTYLVNASFEYSADGTEFGSGANDVSGGLYGWTVPDNLSGNYNIQVCDNTNNASGFGSTVAPAEGNHYFFNRQGWTNTTDTLSQTTPATLPAGKYFLTVNYKSAEQHDDGAYRKSTLKITINDGSNDIASTGDEITAAHAPGSAYFNESSWKTKGVWFTLSNDNNSVTVNFIEALNGTSKRADLMLDNVKLYKWSTDDATNYANASESSPLNMSDNITNKDLNETTNGWTSTLGYQNSTVAINKFGDFSGYFFENWNPSAGTGKMCQTISGLPNGTYKLTLAAFGNNETETTNSLYIFANDSSTAVKSSDPTFYSVITPVTDGTLEIGVEAKTGNSNWIGIDNASLDYLGAIATPTLSANRSDIEFTQLYPEQYFTVFGINLSSDISLTPPTGITLSTTSITASAAESGVTVTATYDNSAAVSGSISLTSGSLSESITVTAAQYTGTDVTSTYLSNADFNTCNYLYNATASNHETANTGNLATVSEWDSTYSDSWGAGASFEYGTAVTLDNNNIPEMGPNYATGSGEGCLAIISSWGATNQYLQATTLPAGSYKLLYSVNNTASSTAGTSLVGFITNDGTQEMSSLASFPNEWTIDSVVFNLTKETAGYIQIGTKSPGSGAASNAHVVFDKIMIVKVANIPTSIDPTQAKDTYTVFTNNGDICVKFDLEQASNVKIAVYDIQGRLVTCQEKMLTAGEQLQTVDKALSSGIYLVQITNNGQSATYKIAK